jgi:hypothetical protein
MTQGGPGSTPPHYSPKRRSSPPRTHPITAQKLATLRKKPFILNDLTSYEKTVKNLTAGCATSTL